MKSRRLPAWLAASAISATWALAFACGGSSMVPGKQPNVVLIYADDLGWSDSGAYGNEVVETPNIDRLAAEGVLFERAYTAAPSCSASRGALLTGRYPHTNGLISLLQWDTPSARRAFPLRTLRTHRHSMARGETLLPQELKRLGYHTAIAGKWHVSIEGPTAWGFDEELDMRSREFEKLTAPFFFYYAPSHTHQPFHASGDFRYGPEEIPLPPYFRDDPELRRDFASYYSAVSNMDREIGAILGWLDASGFADDTIVVFASDHGPAYARAKATLYEWGTRVPLIVRCPGAVPPGGRSRALVSTVDLYPTLLDLMGRPIPQRLQGESLLPNLQDPGLAGREAVFSEENYHVYYNPTRAVHTERWKYIRNFLLDAPHPAGPGAVGIGLLVNPLPAPPRPSEELYDLEADPLEGTNLAGVPEHAAALAELRGRLDAWMAATDDDPTRELSIEPPQEQDRADGWYGPQRTQALKSHRPFSALR
jgi:N-sulfoglucosamine sulfohydrolase